jgi:hypothetical protein
MVRHWTAETDREADELYATFSDAKIRRYQDLARQQMRMAFAQGNEDAYLDLEAMQEALTREMLQRVNRKGTGPRVRAR